MPAQINVKAGTARHRTPQECPHERGPKDQHVASARRRSLWLGSFQVNRDEMAALFARLLPGIFGDVGLSAKFANLNSGLSVRNSGANVGRGSNAAGFIPIEQCLLTARCARCRAPRRRSVDRTDSSHTTVAAPTALHAPHPPFAIPAVIGSIGCRSRFDWL